MNDAEALAAIRAELDKFFRGQANPYEALNAIAYITGLNGGAK
jgi:hypothetical protein